MKTLIFKVDSQNMCQDELKLAANVIKQGGLVAFPTETVYGLGANGLDALASSKIYTAKGRPSDNPLILHISDLNNLSSLTQDVPSHAQKLIDAFWPGPLTLIFKKSHIVPLETTGGLDTVAIRMPKNPIALALIELAQCPIAAPSANVSGRPSPTKASHVIEDMDGKIEVIIDGGSTDIGLESTIVDVTEAVPVVLRPGYITLSMLCEVVGEVALDQGLVSLPTDLLYKPKAPGMKYRHYAPQGDLCVVEGESQNVVKEIKRRCEERIKQGYKVGIMAVEETKHHYEQGIVKVLGARDCEKEIGAKLFETLREFDLINVDYIYSEAFSEENYGYAIMNRLLKAAGYNRIKV